MLNPDVAPQSEREQIPAAVRLEVGLELQLNIEWRLDEATDEITKKLTPAGMNAADASAVRSAVVNELNRMVSEQEVGLRDGMLVKSTTKQL